MIIIISFNVDLYSCYNLHVEQILKFCLKNDRWKKLYVTDEQK